MRLPVPIDRGALPLVEVMNAPELVASTHFVSQSGGRRLGMHGFGANVDSEGAYQAAIPGILVQADVQIRRHLLIDQTRSLYLIRRAA